MSEPPSGPPILDAEQHAFLGAARSGTLATVAPDGLPRLVPCCFVLVCGAGQFEDAGVTSRATAGRGGPLAGGDGSSAGRGGKTAGRGGKTAVLYTPLDEKPKRVADPRALARVRDLIKRPDVALLVDRWSEDWTELAWLRIRGRAALLEPSDAPDEHAGAVAALRVKYPQYRDHRLEDRALIRIEVLGAVWWSVGRAGGSGQA